MYQSISRRPWHISCGCIIWPTEIYCSVISLFTSTENDLLSVSGLDFCCKHPSNFYKRVEHKANIHQLHGFLSITKTRAAKFLNFDNKQKKNGKDFLFSLLVWSYSGMLQVNILPFNVFILKNMHVHAYHADRLKLLNKKSSYMLN